MMESQTSKPFTLGVYSQMSPAKAAAMFALSIYVVFRLLSFVLARQETRKMRKTRKTLSATAPGTWESSSYRFPLPPPYPDWSIETTKPLPYRPFRYGPNYFTTMGLRNIKVEEWIELDNDYPRFHQEKARRIADRGSKCCYSTAEAYSAATELLYELVEYLPARYPTLYQRSERGIKNLWSGEDIDLSEPLSEDPMQTCGRLTQDDLVIMMQAPDGQYYLKAGAILLAGFWRLQDKLNMPLSEIHTSGNVPHYKEKLQQGMDNLFRRLKPGLVMARNNYVVQVDDSLPWSHSVGSEDSEQPRGWHLAQEDPPIEQIHLRCERQTLHRLPKTGGIVFTIRTYLLPIVEIAREDYVPGRLASAIRSWTPDVARYKGKFKYEKVLLSYLDAQHQAQIERGLTLTADGQQEEEKRSSYPW